jgi:ParB family chromosome partitioning protein
VRLLASPRQLIPYPELNTRKRFPRERLVEIGTSMRKHGCNLQNLVLHDPKETVDVDGSTHPLYWIVAGETRWRSALLIVEGVTELEWEPRPNFRLDCRVSEFSRAEALEILLIENEQRGGLTVIEAARAIRKLIEEEGYTQARVAEVIFGNPAKQPHVNQLLGLLEMPEPVQDLLEEGHLVFTHIRDQLRPLYGRLSEDRRATVFDAIAARIRAQVENGGKVGGPWLTDLVREADAEENRLRGQVSLLDDLPGAAPVAPAAAGGVGAAAGGDEELDEAGKVGRMVAQALEGHDDALAELSRDGASDAELLEFLTDALPNEMPDFRRIPGVGAWRVLRTPEPAVVLHPEGASYPWNLRLDRLAEHVRATHGIGLPPAPAGDEDAASAESPIEEPRSDSAAAAQVDALITAALPAGLIKAPEGATDAELKAAIASVLGEYGNGKHYPIPGVGTWFVQADSHTLRISVIPAATGNTQHIRDGLLLEHVRRIHGIGVPSRTAPATESARPAPPASRPPPAPAPAPPARPAPTTPAASTPARPAPATPAASTPAPISTLPLPGSGRAEVPEGAGLAVTLLAALGGRPCTLSFNPMGDNVMITVAPRIAKAGEGPLAITKPAAAVDAELLQRIDQHFK